MISIPTSGDLAEFEAHDENRWRDMVISIRDRTMPRDVHDRLRSSLRDCMRRIRHLGTRNEQYTE